MSRAPFPAIEAPLTDEELSLIERLDAIEAGTAPYQSRRGIEARLAVLAVDPEAGLPVSDGRVTCRCGRTTFPENWSNHLLSYSGRRGSKHGLLR